MNNLTNLIEVEGLDEIRISLEQEQIMPEGIEFCEHIEYCFKICGKLCFNRGYCGIRTFLNKYKAYKNNDN